MTSAEIKTIIEGEMECNEIASKIIDTLIPHDGKKLTTRHETLLREAGVPNARILKRYGWTEIRWDDPKHPDSVDSIMVQRSETNVTIDTAWMLEDNTRWFKALDDRNTKRREILANDELLEKTANAITQFIAAKKELQELVTYENFDGARFKLQSLAGLKD